MRAIVCREYGPPERLHLETLPDPVAGPGEIVMEVKAASVSFPDTLIIQNLYQGMTPLPFTPGGEASGVVVEVGEGVEGLAVGDAVVGGSAGSFAERVVAQAQLVRPLPEGADFAEAPGLLYAYGTALYALRDRGELREDETLLVLGAGGNVGLAAVELGKHLGARVIAAASTAEKLEVCREKGADDTIDTSREHLKERTKELTGGRGADVVYDAVGGDLAEQALRATAWKGRFLVIGFPAGIPSIPLNLPLLKGCQIGGVFFGKVIMNEPEAIAEIMSELHRLSSEGLLHPHVSRPYALAEAPQALRDLMERRVVGRVVVEPWR